MVVETDRDVRSLLLIKLLYYMRIHNKIQVLSVMNAHLVAYPTPMNLNWSWNGGSLAGIMLASQMLTGILLAMHYVSHVDYAFASVQHMMTDVPSGMILRYTHANGASMFFIVVYLHIFRGMYYNSGAQPREIVWISGVVILLVMIITAFIGYVLPWGQMSFWGTYCAQDDCSNVCLLHALVPTKFLPKLRASSCAGLLSNFRSSLHSSLRSSLLSNLHPSLLLQCCAFYESRIQALRRYGPHSWLFVQIAVGLLLSDGYAEMHGNGVRITFPQEKSNVDYFMYVRKLLYKLGYVSSLKSQPLTRQGYKGRVRIYYRLHTYTFASLAWLHKLFYDANGVKIVRAELEHYLTPIALAHAICGDGTWCGYGLALCTNSFTLDDTKRLIDMLQRKFGLVCSYHKTGAEGQYRIYVKAESMATLRSLVLPHMPVEMHYKLGIGTRYKQ